MRCRFNQGRGVRLFELLYDATDLLQGGHMLGGLPYSGPTCVSIAAIANNPHAMAYIKSSNNRGLEMAAKWFADSLPKF